MFPPTDSEGRSNNSVSCQDVIIATFNHEKYVKNVSDNECICYVPKNVHQTPYLKLNYENKNV